MKLESKLLNFDNRLCMDNRIKQECFITNDLKKSVQCHQQQQKVKNNANLFAKLQQREALKMKTSSKTNCQCNGRTFYQEDELNLYLVAMPPSPERPFLLTAKNPGCLHFCTCLYFCLLLLLSVFYCCLLSLLSFIIVVCII